MPLRGSVKIWYWPQSNPPPPNTPQKDPQNENFYFLTYWLEILYITSWLLPHHKSWLETQLQGVCLSVCRLSVVCLSVCHQTPPSLWNRSLPKFIFGFFRPLQGSVKIWYWPQSNPPSPNAPPKMTLQNENFYFLTYWLEILYITYWSLPHHKSWLESQLQGAQLRMHRSISFSWPPPGGICFCRRLSVYLFVCLFVCLSVCNINQKVMDKFWWNFQGLMATLRSATGIFLKGLGQRSRSKSIKRSNSLKWL